MGWMGKGARARRVVALGVLLVALLSAAACQRNPGGQLPEAGGEKLQARRAEVSGFDLVRAWPDQDDGNLALARIRLGEMAGRLVLA